LKCSLEEETGKGERRELVAWIPAWILCCNMLPSLHVFCFFLTTLLFSSPPFCFSFQGFLQQIAMEWIPPFPVSCIVLCVTRWCVCVSERWRSRLGIRAGMNEWIVGSRVGVGSRDSLALASLGEWRD
jgi:hypothetical protein